MTIARTPGLYDGPVLLVRPAARSLARSDRRAISQHVRTRAMLIATVLGMLMVVSTFLASTFIVRRHSQAGDSAESLAQNGAPSVRLLGLARSDARELRIAARELQQGAPAL